MSDTVPLIGPDGAQYEVDSTNKEALDAALAKGYRVESEAEPQTALETAKAGVADVGRTANAVALGGVGGLTAGLGEAALAKLRPDLATEIVKTKAESPVAHGVGEFAGMLVSPINKVGGAITGAAKATTALGRIGAEAAGGAAIGSLYGAGNTVSESALGDSQLTAEKLLVGTGMGAVLGGAGGLLGGAIGETAAKVMPAIGKGIGKADQTLTDIADQRWLKAGGGIQGDIAKIPEAERKGVSDVFRDHMSASGDMESTAVKVATERDMRAKELLGEIGVGDAGGLKSAMPQSEAMEALSRGLEENGSKVGATLKKADEMGAKPSYSSFIERFNKFAEDLNPAELDIIGPDIEKTQKYLLQMGGNPAGSQKAGFQALNDIKSTIQSNTNWVADGPAKFGLKRQLAGILRDEIDTQLAPQIGADLTKEFLDAKKAFGALSQAEKALSKKSATGADAIRALLENADHQSPSAQRLYALDHADRLLTRGMDRELGNRFISPTDYGTGLSVMAGSAAAGNPMPALKGLATMIGHGFLRKRGSAMVATMADAIAKSPTLKTIAASFAEKAAQAPQLAEYTGQLGLTAGTSAAHQLAVHMAVAKADPHYAEMSAMAGFKPEVDDEHAASIGKAHSIASLAATNSKHDDAIDTHLKHVFSAEKPPKPVKLNTQDFGTKRMRQDSVEGYQRRVKEIRALAADPQALIDRVTGNVGNLANVAPGVAAALTARAQAAVQYLAKASAEPPKAGPLAHDWVPPEADRHDFAVKMETVQEPMSALRHAAAGTMTQAHVEALQAVYPTMARDFADRALMKMAESPKSVPYKARLMLMLLTGADPDGSMSQKAIAANQAAIRANNDKPGESGNGAGAPQSSDKLTLASRLATTDQKREMDS